MGGRKRKVEEDPGKKDAHEEEAEEETSPVSSGSKGKKSSSSQQQSPKVNKKKKKASKDVQEGKGSSGEAEAVSPAKKAKSPKKSPSKKEARPPKTVLDQDDEEDDDPMEEEEEIVPVAEEPENLPPVDVLHKLLERMEQHLPKEDRVKYDSQVRKLDWEKISFEGLSAAQCQSTWMYIQERIRRFRVLSEMIPDAREWIQHPWTNFYKSRTFNRHPDMPKKPLSVYMFYYSQHMNKILKKNPELSMPEVAKICSEQYSQLSEEKKHKYKEKCDQMKVEYNKKMEEFYHIHPDMIPILKGGKKAKPPPPPAEVLQVPVHPNSTTTTTYVMNPPQSAVLAIPQTTMTNQLPQPNNIVYDPKYLPKQEKPHFTGAPERPFKPFDLFFKKEMEPCSSDPSFDRQAFAQKCRKEWKEMKNKKKAKWIRSAFENYRKYEADLKEFISQNPGYVPPNASHKNFLTIEDQKILDRSMGRPEKPSSSAYSLFSKEMLNNEDIKKYPSKERMSHISELWKTLPDEKKESYQSEVNEAMGIYRQRYEDWFNGLNDEERKAESDRNNSKSSRKAAAKEKANNNNLGGGQQVLQMGPNQYITLAPPQLQPVLLVAAPSVIPSSTQPMLDSVEKLKRDILEREPVEPVRSRKQLFISEWLPANKKKKLSDANKLWRQMGKKDKCKWRKKLQPQRQKYIEDYTLFVRGLSKQEVELYMDLKEKRDQEEDARKAQMSESDESDSSESESDDSSTNDEERKAESDRNNSKSSRKAAAKEKANNNNNLGGGQQVLQIGPNQYITLAPPQPQPVLLAAASSVIPSSKKPKKKLSDPKKIGVWWQMGKKEKRKWKRKYQPQTPKYIED